MTANGAAPVFAHDEGQAEQGDDAGAQHRRGAADTRQRAGNADGEAAGSLRHIDQGRLSDAAFGTALFLHHLGQRARHDAAEADTQRYLQRAVAGPEPETQGATDGKNDDDRHVQAVNGTKKRRRFGIVTAVGRVKPRHRSLEPGKERSLRQRAHAERQGVFAVLFRRQHAREHHQRGEADQPLQDIGRKIAQQSLEIHNLFLGRVRGWVSGWSCSRPTGTAGSWP